jgi:peptidyl-prolyl cis-trans isomerase SurA
LILAHFQEQVLNRENKELTRPVKKNGRFVLVCFLAWAAAGMSGRADIIEQVLVKVNGDIFTKTELEQRQVMMLRQRNLPADPKNEELKKVLEEITPRIVLDAVDEMLLMQRGRELGYRLSEEQFRQVLDNIKKENKIETEEQFQAALKQEGLTMAELRKSLEKQMIISRVQQNEVMGKIGVSEEEARAYYDAHTGEFTTQPAITLRELLVAVPSDQRGVNVGVEEEAKKKAEALRASIAAGESFEKVAAEGSEAPSRANGGLIGPISRDELAPAIRDLIAPLKVGEMTPVFRSDRGYQVLKLEVATDVKVLPFDQAREQIADKVFREKQRGEFEKYIDKLRAQAIIEWKNEEVKKAYETALAARSRAPAASR